MGPTQKDPYYDPFGSLVSSALRRRSVAFLLYLRQSAPDWCILKS